MQKKSKGQLCLKKVTVAVLRQNHYGGSDYWTDHGVLNPETSVSFGQTQTTSSDVPTCRFYTLK